jgi:hypothetical protein
MSHFCFPLRLIQFPADADMWAKNAACWHMWRSDLSCGTDPTNSTEIVVRELLLSGVHLFLRVFHETPTIEHASCSRRNSHSFSGSSGVHLLVALKWQWSPISCKLLRSTKNACWGSSTCRGFHTDVGCWGMTVVRTGIFLRRPLPPLTAPCDVPTVVPTLFRHLRKQVRPLSILIILRLEFWAIISFIALYHSLCPYYNSFRRLPRATWSC